MKRPASSLLRLGPVAVCACALAACGDDARFDAEAYEIVFSSIVLNTAGASSWQQGENWAQEFNLFVPGFCNTSLSSTTVGPGARTVVADWHGCSVGATDIVGTFEYIGEGRYEALADVTLRIRNVPTTLGLVLRLEPRAVD